MAITQGMCTSFKKELLEGVHDFTSDTFYIALFDEDADLNPQSTTAYATTDEVSGTGYSAGGEALTAVAPTSVGTSAWSDFADVVFSTVSITARGALIYNSSKANRAVSILDFGYNVTKDASDLTITFPTADSQNAIVRIL